jgi:hypothetical protein
LLEFFRIVSIKLKCQGEEACNIRCQHVNDIFQGETFSGGWGGVKFYRLLAGDASANNTLNTDSSTCIRRAAAC